MQILNETESLITQNLNSKQLEAVTSTASASLVIAGAGSGKTSVLTRRVAFLIAKQIKPGNILCLTFTNKAAAEMNRRVRDLLQKVNINLPHLPIWKNDYENSPLLCTFHSLGVKILREFGEKIDLKTEFNILDSSDQKKIIKDILKEMDVDQKKLNPNFAINFISKCKQELLLAKDSKKLSVDYLPIFHQVYQKYEDKLKSNQAVDFDDLILLPHLLLKKDLETRKILQNRWKHILIDEFQDTNPVQFEFVRLLCPAKNLKSLSKEIPDSSIFVVGDDAQSIYGFRGSKIEIILNFEDEYPTTKEIILNQNYRSTQPILDLAEKILSHNPSQKKKDLFTNNKEKISVKYYLARNERDEAEYIIRQIHQQYVIKNLKQKTEKKLENVVLEEVEFIPDEVLTAPKPVQKPINNDPISSMFDIYLDENDSDFETTTAGLSQYQTDSWQVPTYNWQDLKELNECVILYRTHSQSRSLEEAFLKHKVPYRLVSGVRFLDRKEIKDVISMLKFLCNGQDKLSLSRFLPLIMDGVGAKTMEKIIAYLEDFEYPLPQKYQDKILDLLQKFQLAWLESNDLITLTKKIIEITNYENYLKKVYPIKEEREARIENLGEIYSLMSPFDEDKNEELSIRLQKFLEQVSLMSKLDDEIGKESPKINLMSLHQSKGLEFETVFLVGTEDGLLPHQNSFMEQDGIEEEVRLAYVGVTRAKKFLHLISADSRVQFGQIKANPVSRIFRPFLDSHCQKINSF